MEDPFTCKSRFISRDFPSICLTRTMRSSREDTEWYISVSPTDLPLKFLFKIVLVFRTLATDKGFKERVREDMLVRLLDAFVWRNHGNYALYWISSSSRLTLNPLDRQETQRLGFTYVQGMNVLAAPFLYTMPSELEAFFCFAKFIEESCPLYVQPTLEGVHRGLKVWHVIKSLMHFGCRY